MLRVYAGSIEGPVGVGQKGGNATYSLGRWVGGWWGAVNGGGEAPESEKEEDCKEKIEMKKGR